ncbi:hypothetical protein [Vibrio owensii]|uniref:hypothetical protein n=1 Tax=Vibrio owensii TaxID=696485 RepID=UPI003CC6D45A
MKNQFQFLTTCEDSHVVGSYGEDIDEMASEVHCVDIDSEDFLNQYRSELNVPELLSTLNQDSEKSFIDDWGLSCHKARFQGLECLFVRFSKIEHIFIRNEDFSKVLAGEEAEQRRELITDLEDALDDREDWQLAKDKQSCLKALSSFVKDNLSTMQEHRITLASLFTSHTPQLEFIQTVDNSFFPTETPNDPSLTP